MLEGSRIEQFKLLKEVKRKLFDIPLEDEEE
jgi:hypothetical protein